MADEEKKTPPEPPKWEHKTEFGINTKMRDVIKIAVSASEAELKVLRRKMEKLQYGS